MQIKILQTCFVIVLSMFNTHQANGQDTISNHHTLIAGTIAGATEAALNAPLFTIKNRLQLGQPLPKSIPQFWHGATPAIIGSGVIVGSQTALNEQLKGSIHNNTIRAGITGLITGMSLIHVIELTSTTQHIYGIRPKKAVQLIASDYQRVSRGITYTGFRECLFTTGYLGLNKDLANCLERNNFAHSDICGTAIAGIIAIVASHPFDTIKTKLIQDPHKKTYRSGIDIIKKSRMQDLYKGLSPRLTRGMIAIQWYNITTKKVENMLGKQSIF